MKIVTVNKYSIGYFSLLNTNFAQIQIEDHGFNVRVSESFNEIESLKNALEKSWNSVFLVLCEPCLSKKKDTKILGKISAKLTQTMKKTHTIGKPVQILMQKA